MALGALNPRSQKDLREVFGRFLRREPLGSRVQVRGGLPDVAAGADEDQVARARCVELAGKVVTPTFEIGDTCVVNFEPGALRGVLGEPPR